RRMTMSKFTGTSCLSILVLALLVVLRVILHSLGWLTVGTFINLIFIFISALIWISAALWFCSALPFKLLLTAGIGFGYILALVHQLFWAPAFPAMPGLGGNLAGAPDYISTIIIRSTAVVSSIVTGIMIGTLLGGVAFIIRKLIRW